jgi:hypothetical protein
MRRLAIGQLGTNDPSFDEKKFIDVLVEQTIRKIVPHALRAAVKTAKDERKQTLEEAAVRCERDGDLGAARNAREAADITGTDIVYAAAKTAAATAAAAANAAYAAAAAEYATCATDATTACAKTASATAAAYSADYTATDDDIALNMSADIGVQALRAAGAHGIALMDQLIPA